MNKTQIDKTIIPDEVRWERMFPDELERAFENFPLAWFTYGLCEPHGPHNAVGLDSLKAHALACKAAKKIGGIVAPPDYWHIHEIGRFAAGSGPKIGETKTWLTAVPPWIHYRNILYHIRAADAHGFKAAILITGHGGPQNKDFKDLIQYWQPHFRIKLLAIMDAETLPDGKGDHAGLVETSQLWHLEPSCVDMSRLPTKPQPHPNFSTGHNAHEASKLAGEKMTTYQVSQLGKLAKELIVKPEKPSDRKAPLSFAEVDKVWEATLKDVFPTMQIMVQQVDGYPQPPKDSQWSLNWKINLPTF